MLPCKCQSEFVMIQPASNQSTRIQAPVSSDEISALILDDNRFDRMKIRRLFKNSGMPVLLDEADSLDSLESVLNELDFDVILLDYDLPRDSGLDAIKLVRDHPRNHSAATIMITGFDHSEIAVQALKLGCTDYISKGQLSATRLRDTVLAAIEYSERTQKLDQDHKQMTEEMAEKIMSGYSSVLQPELAKIVREIRALKATLADPNSNLPADLEAIEKRCIRLWSALINPQEIGLPTLRKKRLQ